jgi:hypothetical protein
MEPVAFVTQDAELLAAMRALQEAQPAVVLVSGPPGAGKTALASWSPAPARPASASSWPASRRAVR